MSTQQDNIDLLNDALAEARVTVRSYDTKAQIVGVGYIFALGIVFRLGDLLPTVERDDFLFVLVGWIIVIFPILLFGFVLYPTRKTMGSAGKDDASVKGVLYFAPDQFPTAASYLAALKDADGMLERTNELLKVTQLRELKRLRFLRALFSSAVAFFMLFCTQLARSSNDLPIFG
ncbi:MAG: hypothetical protein AAGE61_17890 [Pseudomonadota bacterium]